MENPKPLEDTPVYVEDTVAKVNQQYKDGHLTFVEWFQKVNNAYDELNKKKQNSLCSNYSRTIAG